MSFKLLFLSLLLLTSMLLSCTPEEKVDSKPVVISGSEYADMTPSELGARLRAGGSSEYAIKVALAEFERNKAKQGRWVEQQEHWKNVDAFSAGVAEINADRVIDRAEHQDMCFKVAQWRDQLEAAREYVQEYREVEPGTVTRTPGLQRLESQVEQGLAVVRELEPTC